MYGVVVTLRFTCAAHINTSDQTSECYLNARRCYIIDYCYYHASQCFSTVSSSPSKALTCAHGFVLYIKHLAKTVSARIATT